MNRDQQRIASLPAGRMCKGCACRRGTEANETAETQADLAHALTTGCTFYCHESTAVENADGFYTDRFGLRYTLKPENQWRVCRGFIARMKAQQPVRA